MLKIMRDRWAKNEGKLKAAIEFLDINILDYKDLVRLTFREIFNNDENGRDVLNLERITEIDDGSYQGTLIYLIPFDCYEPDESDYLMTYVGYGSCSGCDALQSIQGSWISRERQEKDILTLCKDIITNTVKPYNYGWRHNADFDVVEENENAQD